MPITRELSITYAGYTVGGSSGIHPCDNFRFEKTYRSAFIEFEFLIVSSDGTTATFNTMCATAEAAYRTPRGALTVSMNGTELSFDPSSNTGFDSAPKIEKVDSPANTATSRLYRVHVDVALPADLSGQAGRSDSRVNLMTPQNLRRSLEVSGEYTALGSNDARAQYNAQIASYVSALEGTFSAGTWVKVDESADANDTTKSLTFRALYREVYSDYRLESLVDVRYESPNRQRTLYLSGVYVANGGTGSRSQYSSSIASYASGVTGALGGSWHLDDEDATTDDNDQRCTFSRVYRELHSDGLLKSTIEIRYDAAKLRTLTISGTYMTAAGGSALEQYQSNGGTYASAIITALTGTWKQVSDDPIKDDNDQRCDFVRVYRELPGLGSPGPNTGTLVYGQSLFIRRANPAPGDTYGGQGGDPTRLQELMVDYACSIDVSQNKNVTAAYSTILSDAISQVQAATSAGSIAIVREEPDFDPINSILRISLLCVASVSSGVLEYEETTERPSIQGLVFEPVWTGNRLSRYVYQGIGFEHARVTIRRRSTKGTPPLDPTSTRPKDSPGTWFLIGATPVAIPRKLGQVTNGTAIDVIDEVLIAEWEAVQPEVGAPAPGGAPGTSLRGGPSAATTNPQQDGRSPVYTGQIAEESHAAQQQSSQGSTAQQP
jgi:hypothetical protein